MVMMKQSSAKDLSLSVIVALFFPTQIQKHERRKVA